MKYAHLTGAVIGHAMTVHKALGNGFQELIYQRALEIEMSINLLEFKERVRYADLLQRETNRIAKS